MKPSYYSYSDYEEYYNKAGEYVPLHWLFDKYFEYEPLSLKVQKDRITDPLTFCQVDRILCWDVDIIVPEDRTPDLAFLRIGDTLSFRLNEKEWCENAKVYGRRYKDGNCILSITIFKSCIKDVLDVLL